MQYSASTAMRLNELPLPIYRPLIDSWYSNRNTPTSTTDLEYIISVPEISEHQKAPKSKKPAKQKAVIVLC